MRFWNVFFSYIGLIGLFYGYAFGWQTVGCLAIAIKWLAFGHLDWTPEKDKQPFRKSFRVHSQDGFAGPHWGIGFNQGGRRHFYFHDYMGWHNLSELHRRGNCDDPAYCPWHGSL